MRVDFESLVGSYHINHDKVCEDFCSAFTVGEYGVVVVADGIGSAKHPDIASYTIGKFIKSNLRITLVEATTKEEVEASIRYAFELAHFQMLEYIDNYFPDNKIHDFGTTLSVGILAEDYICYGHVGDSGLLAKKAGFIPITHPQNGSERHITFSFLRAKDRWEFGSIDGDFEAILGLTDGIYDVVYNLDLNEVSKLDMLEEFMNANLLLHLHWFRSLKLSDDDLSIAYVSKV